MRRPREFSCTACACPFIGSNSVIKRNSDNEFIEVVCGKYTNKSYIVHPDFENENDIAEENRKKKDAILKGRQWMRDNNRGNQMRRKTAKAKKAGRQGPSDTVQGAATAASILGLGGSSGAGGSGDAARIMRERQERQAAMAKWHDENDKRKAAEAEAKKAEKAAKEAEKKRRQQLVDELLAQQEDALIPSTERRQLQFNENQRQTSGRMTRAEMDEFAQQHRNRGNNEAAGRNSRAARRRQSRRHQPY